MHIAFYAPMKPPTHPVPSGDRRMARALIKALKRAGHTVALASRLRTWEGEGSQKRQARFAAAGARTAIGLVERYGAADGPSPPDLWFTYHLYHKAPDHLGPAVARALDIPYVVAEASVAAKQAGGPWDAGFRATRDAVGLADHIVALNPADIEGVAAAQPSPRRITLLTPFLDTQQPGHTPGFKGHGSGHPPKPGRTKGRAKDTHRPVEQGPVEDTHRSGPVQGPVEDTHRSGPVQGSVEDTHQLRRPVEDTHQSAMPVKRDQRLDRRLRSPVPGAPSRAALAAELELPAQSIWLICVAMMRPGAKRQSYSVLGDALARLPPDVPEWHLAIVGDGTARREVQADFEAKLPGRYSMLGELDEEAVAELLPCCDLFTWPAIDEAYGIALLEAQAAGLPVAAGYGAGVATIVRDGTTGLLAPAGNAEALSAAIARLLRDPRQRANMAAAAAHVAMTEHGLDSAAGALDEVLHAARAFHARRKAGGSL